jgi:hypothetical protein
MYGGERAMRHEEFAERAARRLEAEADRLEEEGRRLGIHGAVSARAGEMRLAALLTREEAEAVTRAERGSSTGSSRERRREVAECP